MWNVRLKKWWCRRWDQWNLKCKNNWIRSAPPSGNERLVVIEENLERFVDRLTVIEADLDNRVHKDSYALRTTHADKCLKQIQSKMLKNKTKAKSFVTVVDGNAVSPQTKCSVVEQNQYGGHRLDNYQQTIRRVFCVFQTATQVPHSTLGQRRVVDI